MQKTFIGFFTPVKKTVAQITAVFENTLVELQELVSDRTVEIKAIDEEISSLTSQRLEYKDEISKASAISERLQKLLE